MKVTLGVILAGGFPVPGDFVVGYSLLQQTMIGSIGSNIDRARVLFDRNFPIDWARNHCVASFLDNDDGDYLLFLDADMIHPPDMANRLVAHGKDIVTAHYVARRPPHFTVAMKKTGPGKTEYQSVSRLGEESGLIEVDAAGAGALLISRRVLAVMREMFRKRAIQQRQAQRRICSFLEQSNPALLEQFVQNFSLDTDYLHVSGDDWFRYQDGDEGLRSRSEDMWFFEQAKLAGFQAYLDADVKCQHITQFAVDYRYHQPYREAYEREQKESVQA